jgi:hypothetical protein
MKTVEFKFDVGQEVKVGKAGVPGIVKECVLNSAGNYYYVQTEKGSAAFNERFLVNTEEG